VTSRPSAAEVRKDMGIASAGEVRGQRDTVGYASTREGMERVWASSIAIAASRRATSSSSIPIARGARPAPANLHHFVTHPALANVAD